jgi:Fur family ferric uptake transcriptional regulator
MRIILIGQRIIILVTMLQMEWETEAWERLRAAGHRAGGARARLIDYLGSQTCCRAAQEIHAALTARGEHVGLATVYRALDTLAEHGLVQRVDIGDGIARYEPVRPDHAEHHHHLVCGECGKVEPFADRRLEQAIEQVEERSGFSVATHDVLLRGACADCRTD